MGRISNQFKGENKMIKKENSTAQSSPNKPALNMLVTLIIAILLSFILYSIVYKCKGMIYDSLALVVLKLALLGFMLTFFAAFVLLTILLQAFLIAAMDTKNKPILSKSVGMFFLWFGMTLILIKVVGCFIPGNTWYNSLSSLVKFDISDIKSSFVAAQLSILYFSGKIMEFLLLTQALKLMGDVIPAMADEINGIDRKQIEADEKELQEKRIIDAINSNTNKLFDEKMQRPEECSSKQLAEQKSEQLNTPSISVPKLVPKPLPKGNSRHKGK